MILLICYQAKISVKAKIKTNHESKDKIEKIILIFSVVGTFLCCMKEIHYLPGTS